ncbi:taste receptor type 2 member 134-like [Macrotis lagotis]|uniref:taste receptor type 2 member 134-like n=1 Tax=Macrotis lagotis TaxID=92651 RepID=UPI003D68C45F
MLSREEMPSLLILFFMIFFLLESLVAIIENGFIIIVLGREWVQSWTLPPGDMILVSLGISRFFLQLAAILSNFFSYFSSTGRTNYAAVFWNFANVATFWFTTLLAIFYCVKISSFTNSIFLWMKWRISRYVPWLLLWSLLISFLTMISSSEKFYLVFQSPVNGNYSEKNTSEDKKLEYHVHFFQSLRLFVLIIPFFFFLISIILLISSLCQHLGNMQHHNSSPQDPRMQVHITSLKSFFFFLIFYISYFLPLIISILVPISIFSSLFWVWEIVTYAGISIYPLFQILNSSKLRRALNKMTQDLHKRNSTPK